MANAPLSLVLRHIRKLAGAGNATDRQLLHRFATQHEEAAFEMLVERYGPAILGVCRRVLRHEHDAEDVFQATFLTLARKASSIRKPEALGCWLYGVASRLALKMRASVAKRHRSEFLRQPEEPSAGQELCAALDEELNRLAWRYQAPIVLCYLEGKTRAEAARQLGWSLGTLKLRLSQGREILRDRLTRRGLTLSAVLAAVGLAQGTVSATLVISTARAAVRFATGSYAGVSAKLAEGILKGMLLSKLKIAATLILVASLVGVGAGILAGHGAAAKWLSAQQKDTLEALASRPKRQELAPDGNKTVHPDLYGDPLPAGALARLGTVRLRQGAHVCALAFSPDGQVLASAGYYYGGEDTAIHLWEVTTGKELGRLVGHERTVHTVAFSPDGKALASISQDGTIRLWDMATGKELRRCGDKPLPDDVLAFSTDGKLLASTCSMRKNHPLTLWDSASGKEVRQLQGHDDMTRSLVFSADGTTLASAGEGPVIYLWDVTGGKELRRIEAGTAARAMRRLLAFSQDGKVLASASADNTIRLWDTATGKERDQLRGHKAHILSLALSADGKTLVSGSYDKTIRFWETATGKELYVRPIETHAWDLAVMAFSPDEKLVAAGGTRGTVHLWETATGKEIHSSGGHQSPIEAAAFLPDGRTVVSVGWDATARLWEAATGKELHRSEGVKSNLLSMVVSQTGGRLLLYSAALSSDGKLLAMTDYQYESKKSTVRVWEVASGREVRSFDGKSGDYLRSAFSPDGNTLALAGSDNTIRLWAAATGKERLRLTGLEKDVFAVVFSPDGKTLASCSQDGTGQDRTARLWDVTTGKELYRLGHASGVFAVAFSPDGRTLATAGGQYLGGTPGDDRIHLWEVATGRERGRLTGHQNLVTSLAYAPDGKALASGSSDSTVRLWEPATGKELRRFEGHRGLVKSVAFSGDGQRLASGGLDTTVLVWDIASLVQKRMRQMVSVSPEELNTLWDELGNEDASKAYRALCTLVAAPKQSLPFLQQHLRSIPPVDHQRIGQLILDLDSDRFPVREKATQELNRFGELAGPALRNARAAKASAEARQRLEQLLTKREKNALSPEQLQVLRAIEVLEHIASDEARQVLAGLASGAPEARLTQEAKASLERLAKRP